MAPAAIVMALLSELVVGGVGKTLVAVRRSMVRFNLEEILTNAEQRERGRAGLRGPSKLGL